MSSKRRRGRPKPPTPNEVLQISDVYEDTTCDVCDAEFVDFEDLQVHKAQVHMNSSNNQEQDGFNGYNCYFCTENYSNAEWLALHIRDDHLIHLYFCEYCLRAFTDLRKMRVHEQLHISNKEDTYSCSNCPLFLHNREDLKKHEYEEHEDIKDGILLNSCFPYLTSHLNIKADDFLKSYRKSDQVYICVCKFKTDELNEYFDHLKWRGCKSFVCDKCNKPHQDLGSLKNHFVKNACGKPRSRRCDSCNMKFEITEYSAHRRKCLKILVCKNCFKPFKTIEELTMHQSEHASIMKMKQCFYCRLELYNLRVYKNHVEKCHGKNYFNYKYNCVYCGDRIFSHPQKLFAHFFSSHRDVFPFRCNICEKDFRIRKQFTIHIKVVHNSIGFVEFTEALNVHFNQEKMDCAYQPLDRQSLFTEEEENEFKDAGLYIVDKKPKAKRTRKTTNAVSKKKKDSESSDDEPLIKKRKIVPVSKLNSLVNKRKKKSPRLTCKICRKFCYTVQHYNRHVALHFKENNVNCVKCDATFKSKKELDQHLEEEHETAHITSKLKSLLEKKKLGVRNDKTVPVSKRFGDTIKKVPTENEQIKATVKEVKEKSAKNFLETFTPEIEKEKRIEMQASVTIKPVIEKNKAFKIKMVKCDLKPFPTTKPKLKMPERVDLSNDLIKAKVNLRTATVKDKPKLNFGVREDGIVDIPEVGEEVVCKEETRNNKEQEIVYKPQVLPVDQIELEEFTIKELPKEYGPVRIATLQAEAPYFKIVPLESLVNPRIEEEYKTADEIQLPSGTLVRTNPLAHLMKGKSIEDVGKHKYYAPKLKNPQKALANALMRLNERDVKGVVRKKVTRTVKRKSDK